MRLNQGQDAVARPIKDPARTEIESEQETGCASSRLAEKNGAALKAEACSPWDRALQNLLEPGGLDVLKERRRWRQSSGIRKGNIESPIANRRPVDRAVRVVLTQSLSRVIQGNK